MNEVTSVLIKSKFQQPQSCVIQPWASHIRVYQQQVPDMAYQSKSHHSISDDSTKNEVTSMSIKSKFQQAQSRARENRNNAEQVTSQSQQVRVRDESQNTLTPKPK